MNRIRMRDRLLSSHLAAVAGGTLLLAANVWPQTAPAREAFLKLIDRPLVALAPETKSSGVSGVLDQIYLRYTADAAQRVPGILIKPRSAVGRLPVVIALHGTGGYKNGQAPLLNEPAGKGFLAVAHRRAISRRADQGRLRIGRIQRRHPARLSHWQGASVPL